METKKILLVDDEADFCLFAKKNLEAVGGFEVGVCTNGKSAFEQAKELQPDLIILDILMPGISGPEIAERLKQDEFLSQIPLLFLTGIFTEQAMEEWICPSDRPVLVLEKPITAKRLVEAIESALAPFNRRR